MVATQPTPKSATVSSVLSRVRQRDTEAELALRRVLHSNGLRYRVNFPVPGMPRRTIDVAFTRLKIAVFIDGCFWHGCPQHCVAPKNNAAWWQAKLDSNRQRDAETDLALQRLGWRVIRVWEHEKPNVAADTVIRAVHSNVELGG